MSMQYKHVGLDIDGVLCDFATGIIAVAQARGLGHLWPACGDDVKSWNMCENPKDFLDLFLEIQHDPEFWLGLPPIKASQKFFANGQAFIPEMYITRRVVPSEVSAEWLKHNGFPKAPVYTVQETDEKLYILRDLNIDVYADDLVSQIRMLRQHNINAILFKAPYQRSEDVSGLPIIEDLSELVCEKSKKESDMPS